jgi:MFS transporter, ACS family, tartrate transporter
MYGYLPAFWSMPAIFLGGPAAAASIGFINSIGNLGGFVGPYLVGYLTQRTHSFEAGVLFLSAAALVAASLISLLPLPKPEIEPAARGAEQRS